MVFVLVGFDGGLWAKLEFVCGSGGDDGVFVCGYVGGGGGGVCSRFEIHEKLHRF